MSYPMIGDRVRCTVRHPNGYTESFFGVLMDTSRTHGYVERGSSSFRAKIPLADIVGLEDRTPDETAVLFRAPVQVTAPWRTGQWSTRRFASLAAANEALSETRERLAESYVRTQNDPIVTVGARTWTAHGWVIR